MSKHTKSALSTQVGGDHYTKYKIQPFELSMANNLDPLQHTIIKYVMRFRDKNGIQDLDKAIHTINLLKQFEYGHEDEWDENRMDRIGQNGNVGYEGDCV